MNVKLVRHKFVFVVLLPPRVTTGRKERKSKSRKKGMNAPCVAALGRFTCSQAFECFSENRKTQGLNPVWWVTVKSHLLRNTWNSEFTPLRFWKCSQHQNKTTHPVQWLKTSLNSLGSRRSWRLVVDWWEFLKIQCVECSVSCWSTYMQTV